MKYILILVALGLSLSAQAVELKSGETANINGTAVSCESSGGKCRLGPCSFDPSVFQIYDSKGIVDNNCLLDLRSALEELKQLNDAGACR